MNNFLVLLCPTKKLFVIYLKYKFNWASCVLFGNAT